MTQRSNKLQTLSAHPEWLAGLDGMGLVVLHIRFCLSFVSFVSLSAARDSGDHTLFFGLRKPMIHAALVIAFSPLSRLGSYYFRFFLVGFLSCFALHLLFCSWF